MHEKKDKENTLQYSKLRLVTETVDQLKVTVKFLIFPDIIVSIHYTSTRHFFLVGGGNMTKNIVFPHMSI